jgi:pyruvate dehydrogenase E1 component alpha subunit
MAKPATKPKVESSPAKPTASTKPPGAGDNSLSADQLKSFYRDMLLIRRFEERAGQLYGMGLIGGFCHLYIGQEAVVVGMQSTVIDKDAIITSYRDHGHMLACGMDPKGVMAELTGRASGYSKGKGGSMHMFSREKSFYGGHEYNGNKNVSLTYFGDGSANQGQVYEAMNMAALWKLPAVYIIENNRYGMGTSVERASAITELYRHGESFGIPGERVDGMDVVAVKAAGEKAVEHARSGEGPYILEMQTYRYRGHSMSDPAKYRTKEEVDKYRNERDPIDHVRKILLEEKMTDEAALKAVDADIRKIVNDAAEFAQHSPEPDPSELWTDVLVGA